MDLWGSCKEGRGSGSRWIGERVRALERVRAQRDGGDAW